MLALTIKPKQSGVKRALKEYCKKNAKCEYIGIQKNLTSSDHTHSEYIYNQNAK